MALCISIPSFLDSVTASSLSRKYFSLRRRPSNSVRFLNLSLPTWPLCICRASNSQPGPSPKQSASTASKKRKKKGKGDTKVFNPRDIEVEDDFSVDEAGPSSSTSNSSYLSYHPTTLPKPPAGFVLDDHGKVLMASNKRIATMVDPLNNLPLECVIRRIFRSSKGDECMLLCPVDTPVQILKSKNIDGWSAVSDDEVETILPAAAYALAKIHMHLVHSGFCYTARGGFCYSEEDIFDFCTDDGQDVDVDGLPNEGVEITCFDMDGAHYMIYTPSDPLLFVATKDKLGQLTIADDELLEDPATISAIDEETEFNALVEEEAALLESVLGKE
ncbi:uncharacterized protein LOC111777348 [Cucurbita pepo subsp. pepo]|uniref:uncharacterized protein LOC111777348 n=1 Tax=Cucurbita pepo subsp. pepo TaxID=3664 RepID=UPI000C9D60C9|nr:uncharacterized protein LOC111777348 [Cucurbita pepo subsp. pepo]